jgi:hypothetical protein
VECGARGSRARESVGFGRQQLDSSGT